MNIAKTFPGILTLGAALSLGSHPAAAKEAPTGADLARQLNQAFIDVAQKVSPAVVVINVAHKPEYSRLTEENNPFFDMVPELRRGWEEQLKKRRRQPVFDGEGSGLIIREDGYILTNSHVVEAADRIVVRLQDGTEYDDVEVKGVDPQSDVAVLKIPARGLTAAKLGDSSRTRVGEFAIAIGAPFQLDYSVTVGHVSGKSRRILPDQIMIDQDFIQTDASINPGNSGGPLVNIDGEVIGINTLVHGMNQGIGFAVPINLAKEVGDRLIQTGKFPRAWLGVKIRDLADSHAYAKLAPGLKDGVVVIGIIPKGPAANSELEPADVIISVDGKPTPTVAQLRSEIRLKPIGQPVALNVVRGTERLKFNVKPGELPIETEPVATRRKSREEVASKGLGLKVQSLTRELARQFEVEAAAGVIVTQVESGSLAEQKGIKPGDVITDINRKKVTSPEEFGEALKSADLKQGVIVHLTGETGRRFEILKDSGD